MGQEPIRSSPRLLVLRPVRLATTAPAGALREITMTKFQLVYNGNECFPLCNTREEADRFKQKAADQWPEMKVVIKEINQEAKAGE